MEHYEVDGLKVVESTTKRVFRECESDRRAIDLAYRLNYRIAQVAERPGITDVRVVEKDIRTGNLIPHIEVRRADGPFENLEIL